MRPTQSQEAEDPEREGDHTRSVALASEEVDRDAIEARAQETETSHTLFSKSLLALYFKLIVNKNFKIIFINLKIKFADILMF